MVRLPLTFFFFMLARVQVNGMVSSSRNHLCMVRETDKKEKFMKQELMDTGITGINVEEKPLTLKGKKPSYLGEGTAGRQ